MWVPNHLVFLTLESTLHATSDSTHGVLISSTKADDYDEEEVREVRSTGRDKAKKKSSSSVPLEASTVASLVDRLVDK